MLRCVAHFELSLSQVQDITTSLSQLQPDEGFTEKSIIRGVAGRPTSETPALVGAKRGHIDCDVNVDSLAYWNDPQGERDISFESPFSSKVCSLCCRFAFVEWAHCFDWVFFALRSLQGDEKYISFTIDRGGWNNVRMSMEIIFVVAAVTGRTLVLPPKEPLYRLRVRFASSIWWQP